MLPDVFWLEALFINHLELLQVRDNNDKLSHVLLTLKNDIVLVLKLEKFEKRLKIVNYDDDA
jgi:hypothetical protein